MKRVLPFLPLGIILLLICVINLFKPTPLDWTPSFSATDKVPWGTFVLHEMIGDLFPGDSLRVNDQSLYMTLGRGDSSTGKNLLIINESFVHDPPALHALFTYVENGNNA